MGQNGLAGQVLGDELLLHGCERGLLVQGLAHADGLVGQPRRVGEDARHARAHGLEAGIAQHLKRTRQIARPVRLDVAGNRSFVGPVRVKIVVA